MPSDESSIDLIVSAINSNTKRIELLEERVGRIVDLLEQVTDLQAELNVELVNIQEKINERSS